MARAKKTWKLVLTSVILSILILAAFTAVFISLIVPAYKITKEQIYGVLTKALPILIGLILIEIALISSRRGDDDYKDNIDKLAPNAYDSPLYSKPLDDPKNSASHSGDELNLNKVETVVKEVIKEVPVEVVKEVVKEVPVEVIREVPVEVEVIKEVPVEVIKEGEKEVPVEVVKEVPVEVIKEIVKEVEKEVPVEVIKEVVKEVPVEVIKEVPVEIIKHDYTPVQIEVPTVVEKEVEVATEKEVYYSFREALEEEITEAKANSYPLTLVAFKNGDESVVNEAFDAPVFSENGFVYAILPYTTLKGAQKKAKSLGGKVTAMASNSNAQSMIKEVSK